MNLFDETKQYIDNSVRRSYDNAIKVGATVSEVEHLGTNLYKVNVGNLELIYMGTLEGTAKIISVSGEVF